MCALCVGGCWGRTQPTFLMTPAQRRREMEEEVCRHRAQKLMRQAVGREVRLHKIAHSHYPHGILGSENPDDPTSTVYSPEFQERQRVLEKASVSSEKRRQALEEKMNSKHGRKMFKEPKHPERHLNSADGGFKIMPSKSHCSNAPTSSIQLTDVPQSTAPPQKRNPRRFARLMQNETRGRDYNILAGNKKSHLASAGVLECLGGGGAAAASSNNSHCGGGGGGVSGSNRGGGGGEGTTS